MMRYCWTEKQGMVQTSVDLVVIEHLQFENDSGEELNRKSGELQLLKLLITP